MYYNIYIVCLVIAISIAYIYHIDAPNKIASCVLSLVLKRDVSVELKKPLGCPACITFWITLVLFVIVDPAFCWMSLVYFFSSKYIDYTITLIEELLDKIFSILEKIITDGY